MGAKPFLRLIFAAVIIVAGILAILFARSRFFDARASDENKFIDAYIGLSIAGEQYREKPDSLDMKFKAIYNSNGVDSLWMAGYIMKLSRDLDKSEQVWKTISTRLDSLRSNPKSYDKLFH